MRLFFCCDETNQSKIEYWRALVFPEQFATLARSVNIL
jgi:hypothetical protein